MEDKERSGQPKKFEDEEVGLYTGHARRKEAIIDNVTKLWQKEERYKTLPPERKYDNFLIYEII